MSLCRVVTVVPRALQAARVLRPFSTTVARSTKIDHIAKTEIHVSDYSSDTEKAKRTVIEVDQIKPVSGPVMDIAKKAYPLEAGLTQKLSPTLTKFTLEGKIALVTGCVQITSCSQQESLLKNT